MSGQYSRTIAGARHQNVRRTRPASLSPATMQAQDHRARIAVATYELEMKRMRNPMTRTERRQYIAARARFDAL